MAVHNHNPLLDRLGDGATSSRKFLIRQTVAGKFVGWSMADSCMLVPEGSEYFGFSSMSHGAGCGIFANEGTVEVFTADGTLLDTYDLDFLSLHKNEAAG